MDNLTHTLVAVTLARTRLGRKGRGALAALIVGSNAPDLDAVTLVGGGLNYLQWHRGPTHGPLGILGLGLAAAGAVYVWQRRRAAVASAPCAPFATLAALGTFGAFLHVMMDIPTPYGTRLLSPFNWDWYATNWMPIIDVYLLAILAASLAFGHAPHLRRRNAVIALVLMTAYYGLRASAHERAIRAAPLVFGPRLPSACAGARPGRALGSWPVMVASSGSETTVRCLIDVAAIPTVASPFVWQLTAQTSTGYDVQRVSVLDPRLRSQGTQPVSLWRLTRHVSNTWVPVVHRAASADAARVFLGFARFPAVRVDAAPDGSAVVQWIDLRYVSPDFPRRAGFGRRGLFAVTVQLDSRGQVVGERLGP